MRPREKLKRRGVDNLEIVELISLVLGSGVRGRDVEKISREVERRIDRSLRKKKLLQLEDVISVGGVGLAKGAAIVAGIEIGRRLFDLRYHERKKILNSRDAAMEFKTICAKEREYLQVIYLNARYEIIGRETIGIGHIDQVCMRPRDMLSGALKVNAYGIIVAHNHPSGDPAPSNEDIRATKRLSDACKLMNVKLVDHIVVTKGMKWESVTF